MRKQYFGPVPEDKASIRLRMQQRARVQEEMASLSIMLDEWFYQEDMQLTEQQRRLRSDRLLKRILGSAGADGLLQKRLNRQMEGILDRLREDLPDLKPVERLVLSLTGAGFSNYLICHLAGLSCENAAAVMKSRLRARFSTLNSPHRHEYLLLLSKSSCRFSEEMLSL